MDDNTDTKGILSTLSPEDWRRPRGRTRINRLNTIQQDLRSHNLTLPETMDMVSVKDVVDVWRYAILTCMPETTTAMHSSLFAATGIFHDHDNGTDANCLSICLQSF